MLRIAVAVMEKRLGKPVTSTAMAASDAAAAGTASDEGGAGNVKMEARAGAGGSWGDNGQLWRIVVCVVRATATRGHRGLHAAAMSWRRLATEPAGSVRQ